MTSLTGSAGEDFASILRALGYRMERRAAAAAEAGRSVEARALREAAAGRSRRGGSRARKRRSLKQPRGSARRNRGADAAETPVVAETAPSRTSPTMRRQLPNAARAVSRRCCPMSHSPPVAVEEPAAVEASRMQAVSAEPAAAEAPQRAGRAPQRTGSRDGCRRRRSRGGRRRRSGRARCCRGAGTGRGLAARRPLGRTPAAPRSQPSSPSGSSGRARRAAGRRGRGRSRRGRQARAASPRPARPQQGFPQTPHRCAGRSRERCVAAEGAPAVANRARTRAVRRASVSRARAGTSERTRDKGKFGGKGATRADRDKAAATRRPDGGPSHRQYATSAPPRERERPIDPNSPFAKLAALKEQLTANRKDR